MAVIMNSMRKERWFKSQGLPGSAKYMITIPTITTAQLLQQKKYESMW